MDTHLTNTLAPTVALVALYAPAPPGPRPCGATVAGCGYDSLNVAVADPAAAPSVGSNPNPNDVYFNTIAAQ